MVLDFGAEETFGRQHPGYHAWHDTRECLGMSWQSLEGASTCTETNVQAAPWRRHREESPGNKGEEPTRCDAGASGSSTAQWRSPSSRPSNDTAKKRNPRASGHPQFGGILRKSGVLANPCDNSHAVGRVRTASMTGSGAHGSHTTDSRSNTSRIHTCDRPLGRPWTSPAARAS